MSDKHTTHDPIIHKRVADMERTVTGLHRLMVTNGKEVAGQLAEVRRALVVLDKKMDRTLTIAIDSATKVNLMQRQNIHAQETCHPMVLIQEHVKAHEKVDSATADVADTVGKKAGRAIAMAAVIVSLLIGVGNIGYNVIKDGKGANGGSTSSQTP